MNIKTILLTIGIMSVSASASAQKVFNIDLWPNGPKEKSVDREDTARVRVFLPAENKNTRRAVVICPGGGYSHLAIEHEGYDWATFFNQEGIAAIVLKYRMPHGKYEVPISDAEEAIKLVRERSAEWRINPDDVGIMGFSAGGHLASTIATHSVKDAKPNFQILFYPVISMNPEFTHRGSHDNLLGEKPRKKREIEFSNDMQVSRTTPRAWIALSFNDDVVMPINGSNYYTELYKHDVPACIHVYPTGGHGWGFRSSFDYHIEMLLELKAWLKSF
ncbi:MAG: alpha/beta hydrolase [Prevotella sp.]|nr:alpha/beta hydrolase [Prevotella sp.]MBR4601750.1 alpha/beta hydrolase [Prevotella sp.]MBR6139071.1 alpha/beta hydrolase [Prevotella sp.]MDO4980753.1 alpha/beta hydrolase [Prevotellaceae bacterium]